MRYKCDNKCTNEVRTQDYATNQDKDTINDGRLHKNDKQVEEY